MSFGPFTLWLGGTAVVSAIAIFAGRSDAATSAEMIFLKYHQAVYAAAKCDGLPLYQHGPQDPNGPAAQEIQETIASVIREKVNESMGPGEELSMIDEAKRDAHRLIVGTGCDSPEVAELRTLFRTDLAPALPLSMSSSQ
jgi:hypothetical protein